MRLLSPTREVVIVDYGMGNLLNVQRACQFVGLKCRVSSEAAEMATASGVILPGVGAFGDAMAQLKKLDLITCLATFAASGRPLLGICLGMQLLLDKSYEFGEHQGLGLIAGQVRRLPFSQEGSTKVPQVGWNHLQAPELRSWAETPLARTSPGECMYFVHSYFCEPTDPRSTLSITTYAGFSFTSSIAKGNIFGCQFHPERSGPAGLAVFREFMNLLPTV